MSRTNSAVASARAAAVDRVRSSRRRDKRKVRWAYFLGWGKGGKLMRRSRHG
jgi:hypothetical protein